MRREVERSLERPDELEGAVVTEPRGLSGAVLVTRALSWLSVRRGMRGLLGLAMALLSVVVGGLAARGEREPVGTAPWPA